MLLRELMCQSHSRRIERLAAGPCVCLLGAALRPVGRVRKRKDDRTLVQLGHGLDDALVECSAFGADADQNRWLVSAGEARSQLITQLYKRGRPVVGQKESTGSSPLFLFAENELFEHSSLLEPLSDAEKAHLNAKIIRRHFQAGEQLLAQCTKIESVHFVFSCILQVTRPFWPSSPQ